MTLPRWQGLGCEALSREFVRLTGNIFAPPPVRVPAFRVRVDLKKPGGSETLWWHYASVHVNESILKELDARPIADNFSDPVLLDTRFRKPSDLVIDELVR